MYKEEKNRRVARKSTNKRGAEELPRPEKRFVGNRPPLPRPVDVIAEDDEEPASVLVPSNNGRVQPANPPAKRAGTSQFDTNGRSRAISTSHIQTGVSPILPRKTSSLSTKTSIPMSPKRTVHGPGPLELSDKPNRSRKITDMDLDDIMNGSDDEKSEHLALSNFRTPKPTKISKSARDLIDFLDRGPPEDFAPSLPPQSPATSSFKSTGRFQRMMSRLTGSSSSEKLRDESVKLKRTPVANNPLNGSNGTMSLPQTPIRKMPSVIVATPPPRMQPISQQVTPPRSPSLNDSSRPMQRKTSVRKKVPPIHPELEGSVSGPQSPSVTRTLSDEGIRPPGLTIETEHPDEVDEAHQPASPPLLSPEPDPRASADTIASNDNIIFQRPPANPPSDLTVDIVAPALIPVTIQPPSAPEDVKPSLSAADAQSLRQLMSTATTADECRVLVDMFLARVGFPIDRSTNVDPYPSPISSTDQSDIDLESSVIETLLGGDSPTSPSTAIHSTQPSEAGQADESEVGTSDAETSEDFVDSPTQRSHSRIVRDARVNRPLPPASRLLVVV